MNHIRRWELIGKEIEGTLTAEERTELAQMDAEVAKHPLPRRRKPMLIMQTNPVWQSAIDRCPDAPIIQIN